jgi:predicted nucleic acid-binding Zn ribbon protein
MQKFSDPPLTIHEECGGPLEKLISSSALVFKGSGWYVTDYARKGSSSNGKSDTNGSSKKSESKPAPAAAGTSSSTTKSDTKTT